MEFCSGGGIIDLLNKRLRDRLKEAEILNIFADVCEAVAAMHALPRPLLHRDLKVSRETKREVHPLTLIRSKMYSRSQQAYPHRPSVRHLSVSSYVTLGQRPFHHPIRQPQRSKPTLSRWISTRTPHCNIEVQKWSSRCWDWRSVCPAVRASFGSSTTIS